MPGPVLEVQGAAEATVAGAADAASGMRIATTTRTAARRPAALVAKLGRAGFGLLWIDPEVGDGLRNEVRTVLLAEGERV